MYCYIRLIVIVSSRFIAVKLHEHLFISSTIQNLFVIVRHVIFVRQFVLFLRGGRNLSETSAAKAFSEFVCYLVTLLHTVC